MTSPLPPVSPSPPVSPPPLHSSHPPSNVPSERSVSASPCLSHPVTSRPDSEVTVSPLALSSPKPVSPPLTTPRSPPTPPIVPHPGRRSPKVKVKLHCGDDGIDLDRVCGAKVMIRAHLLIPISNFSVIDVSAAETVVEKKWSTNQLTEY